MVVCRNETKITAMMLKCVLLHKTAPSGHCNKVKKKSGGEGDLTSSFHRDDENYSFQNEEIREVIMDTPMELIL